MWRVVKIVPFTCHTVWETGNKELIFTLDFTDKRGPPPGGPPGGPGFPPRLSGPPPRQGAPGPNQGPPPQRGAAPLNFARKSILLS